MFAEKDRQQAGVVETLWEDKNRTQLPQTLTHYDHTAEIPNVVNKRRHMQEVSYRDVQSKGRREMINYSNTNQGGKKKTKKTLSVRSVMEGFSNPRSLPPLLTPCFHINKESNAA